MGNVRKIRQEDKQYIIDNWNILTNDEMADALGISVRTLARWANELGMPYKYNRGNTKKEVTPRKKAQAAHIYVYVRKCCAVCGNYATCDLVHNIDGFQARKFVCWDFELDKEMKGE